MKVIDFLRDFFGGKDMVYIKQKAESQQYKLAVEEFAVQMAINLIAGLAAKCEFKTYLGGKETKGNEYYLWNVEPNINQNSSQFLQELIARLLYFNRVLVVEVNGQLIIAENFTLDNDMALLPHAFTGVSRGAMTFDRTFYMQEVLFFKLNNQDIRILLSQLMAGYSELLDMAVGKYKRAGGRKGAVKIAKTSSGDTKNQQAIDDLFNRQF